MKHFSQEEKEKQRTESHESRVERDFCLHNLENREEKENWFKKSCKSRKERDLLSKNLENREEKEKWKYNSPARERKTWVISSRDFLEIETLVNDWLPLRKFSENSSKMVQWITPNLKRPFDVNFMFPKARQKKQKQNSLQKKCHEIVWPLPLPLYNSLKTVVFLRGLCPPRE